MVRITLFLAAFLALAAPGWAADDDPLDALFTALQSDEAAAPETRARIENQIWEIWSQSGSPSMDFLLERGREALAASDTAQAIEHFTALVEGAPDFAEGFNARATAYYQAGLVGPALADIGRTLTLEPRHFGALSGLGLILEETGDIARAVEAYGAALAIHPHRPDLREALKRLEAELQGKAI